MQRDYKNDLEILHQKSPDVVSDFCKLASSYLTRGINNKLCNSVSSKLNLKASDVQSAVEGLAFLFLEAWKNELNEESFREAVIKCGFTEDSVGILHSEYLQCKSLLDEALPQTSTVYPQFSNLEWRFETQVSSKSLKNEIIPRVIMKLDLEKRNKVESVCIQSDIPNIMHMSQVLNLALEESRTNHSRRIQRALT